MSDNKPKIGVVGAGHLGRHHIKHLSQHSGVEFVGVFDVIKVSLRIVCGDFSVEPLQSLEQLISLCDGVHIVTPTNTHFNIAKEFLNHKKDVFIEKPITNTVKEAESLIDLAKKIIDVAVEAGCDAVKLQKKDVENIYTNEFLDSYLESPWGTTQREMRLHREFSLKQFEEMQEISQNMRKEVAKVADWQKEIQKKMEAAQKTLKEIEHAVEKSDKIVLATDPDREGEAISWLLFELLNKKKSKNFERVVFNAVTKDKVLDAINNPRSIDSDLVEAYNCLLYTSDAADE